MVDFLDLLPEERTGTAKVLGHDVPIYPLKVSAITKLARRFPDLRKSLFKDAPEDIRGAAMMEAAPAIVAAGIGRAGDVDLEAAIENRMPQPELMKLVGAILTITYPSEEDAGPLESAADIIAAVRAEANETPSDQQ